MTGAEAQSARRDRWRAAALLASVLLGSPLLQGCEHSGTGAELQVHAASSLTEAFGSLARQFEALPETHGVALSLGGSQVLRMQIAQGAPADIFASANPQHMQALQKIGKVDAPRLFAHNALALVVPSHNPARIHSFVDLPRAKRLVLAAEVVPVGRYTRALLRRAGQHLGSNFPAAVLANLVSEERNTRLVRAKVELGEADAAIIYRSDAEASDRLRVVAIPETMQVRADYLVAVVRGSPRASLARRWLGLLFSEPGRATLRAHGFGVPP